MEPALGLTTQRLLAILGSAALEIQARNQRLDDAIERALTVSSDEAAFRTAVVGRRPYISARTGPRACWAAVLRPNVPKIGPRCPWTVPTSTWIAHLPLRYHLINLGGCIIPTVGRCRVPSIGAGRLDTLRHGDFPWATG